MLQIQYIYVTKQKYVCIRMVVTLPPKFEKTQIGIKNERRDLRVKLVKTV